MRHRTRRIRMSALLAGALVATLTTPGEAYPRPGTTSLITVGFDGSSAKDPVDLAIGLSSWETSISGDGRYIAFSSTATNLVPRDVNAAQDVFVRDRVSGRTEIVSVNSAGQQGAGPCAESRSPSISADGRYVAFTSCASNLVPLDLNLARDAFVHDRVTKRTEIVSVSSAGKQTMEPLLNHDSSASSISPDGRYVGVGSNASDLVPDDTNTISDGFVFDRVTRKMRRISVATGGRQAPKPVVGSGGSGGPSLSWGGRYAAFSSYSDGLVEDDTNVAIDGFVHDLQTNTTERVTVRTGGGQTELQGGAGVGSGDRAISADGRYVTISSWSSTLIPNDSNGTGLHSDFDIFVHDRKTRRTERISVGSDGHEANDSSSPGSISLDGRYVTIASAANNLTPGDTGSNGSNTTTVGPQPGDEDVFLYDRKFGTMEMISVAPDGSQAMGHCRVLNDALAEGSSESFDGVVSGDGQYVAFQSCANNLVAKDDNRTRDEFVRFRGPHLGVAKLSAKGGGTVTLSGQATFTGSVLAKAADAPSDAVIPAGVGGAEIVGGELLYRGEEQDLFLRLDLAQIPALGVSLSGVAAPGDPRVLYGARFVANGASYEIRVARAGVNSADPLNAAMGLFECTETLCTEVAPLKGGYGSTGEQIVVSVPLAKVAKDGKPLAEGGVLSGLRAYTALGGYYSGPSQLLDQVVLSEAVSVAMPRRSVTLTAGGITRKATVRDATFTATFARSAFTGATRVVTRTCLGRECTNSTSTVRV